MGHDRHFGSLGLFLVGLLLDRVASELGFVLSCAFNRVNPGHGTGPGI